MATYKSTVIPNSIEQEHLNVLVHSCTLKWRQRQLLVSRAQQNRKIYLPSLESEQCLVECLQHSPVKLVRIDAALGEKNIKFWADAGTKASKAVFLRLPHSISRPSRQSSIISLIQMLVDQMIAALLLLILSPVIFGFWFSRRRSSEPVLLEQWRVGERGKLFKLFKVRILEDELMSNTIMLKHQNHSTNKTLNNWIRKYKVDEIPYLFNVLRGEMRLLSPRPLTLEQAIQLSLDVKQ